jgi:hypothetical protein
MYFARSFLFGDDLRHRRQKAVHKSCQCSVVHAFGNAGEPTNVAEHDRHHSRLVTEDKLLGVRRELLNVVRQHIARERVADFALPRFYPQIASGIVLSNTLLSNGLCNSCQFLQWGYRTSALDTHNTAGTGGVRQDVAHINTWIAGVPSVTLPATGVGTFSGNALGSVVNNGASYLASGGFTNTYNFGNHTGMFTISNFDGKTVSGTVNGVGAGYSGSLSGSGLTGSAKGVRPRGVSSAIFPAILRPRRAGISRSRVRPISRPASLPAIADGQIRASPAAAREGLGISLSGSPR